MANNSGFILVDASEATSMADTARNALRARSGESGNSPQRLDALVKGLKQQAKEQQQAAAKELAESRTLGKTVKDVLKMVKVIKDDVTSSLDEQKRIAEDTLKAAAGKATAGRAPSQGPRATRSDTGGAYDVDSFRSAAKDIGGMRGPAGAANDLIDEMRVGFNRVRDSAKALGVELYGNSILPEIQKHLQGIIDQINTIKDDEDLLTKMAAAAGVDGGGTKFSGTELEKMFGDHLQNLKDLMREDRDTFFDKQREQLNQLQGGIISNINVGGGGGGGGGGSGRGLESIAEADFQDALFEAFRKDISLKIKSGINTLGSLAVPTAVMNIQQLNKEVNNLQGGMAGNVDLAREFRIETTNALQEIRAQSGFTIQEIGSAAQAVMALGVSGPETIAKQSEVMLMGARALGVEVSDVAQTYGMQARNLKLSADQIPEMITGTLRIAKETGLTARNVLEARKETQAFSEELKRAGALSAQLTNELTRTQAISSKLGLGNFQQDLQRVFMDISQLGNVPDDLAIITAYVRNDLVKMGYGVNEILTGTMLSTVQGQRDFAKATKDSLELLRRQAEAMESEAGASNFLQNVTKGRIKSLEEINRMIQLQTQASETAADRAQRLQSVERQIMEMRAAGLDDAFMGSAIAELTGDTSLKTIEDVRTAISNAQGAIATEQEDLAADFMNKLIKRQAQVMAGTNMNASDARDKAFQELSGTVRGELSGMSIQEISSLAASASQRAAETVADSAEAATDNMVDRVAQGVQKGIQMVAGPFADLVDFFDHMGVGPFVAGVAMFGTAAVLISASVSSLMAGLGKIRALMAAKSAASGVPGAGDLAGRAATAVGSGSAASAAAGAGDAAIGASSSTAATARTISDYVAQIGDAGEELWKQKGKLLKGLAVLAVIGVAIGASIWLMSKVYPDAGTVMNLTAAIIGSTVAFGVLIGAFHMMNTIGKAAQEVSTKMAKEMFVGLLALTAMGVIIGGAMHLLVWAFPSAGEVIGVAVAIGATAVAFSLLAGSLVLLTLFGSAVVAALSGPQAAVTLTALGAAILALTAAAIVIGGGMALLINFFPRTEEIIPVAKAIAASALAFGVLAGAFLGIMAVGAVITGIMFIPGGPLALLGAISLGIAALALTAVALSAGIEMLHTHFKDADRIKATGDAVAAAAGAFGTLAGAFLKLLTMGALLVALPIVGFALTIGALWALVDFAGRMDEAIGMLKRTFRSDEEIQETAKTVELASGAIKSLGEAYKSAVDSADLSWWKAGIDLINNQRALRSLLTFGKQLGPYMDQLQAAYGDTDQMQEVAERVKTAAEVIKSLASAGVELKKYKDETDGVFTDITPEDLTKTMGDLTEIAESMGRYIPQIVANAPDTADVGRIKNAASAMTSISEMIGVTLEMQKEFGSGVFSSGPMEAMDEYMHQLGSRMSDPRGGFHALKRGVEGMPAFRDDEVEKLNMMNEATVAVFETLKTLAEINDEFPNSSTFGRDLGDIQTTLDLAVAVFDENIRPLKNLKNILGMMPSDIGVRAEAFATMMASLKTSLLNIEALAQEFPQGGERSMEVMNDHLRYIASNLDQGAVQSLHDTFAGVGLDLPDHIDALSGGFERLPNLLMQVQRFISRVDRGALTRAHDDIMFIAWALAPLADLAESLTFDAPNIEHFDREIANLILTLGAATQAIPEVLELRSEIQAKVGTRGGDDPTTKTINDALTGPPGAGSTIGGGGGDDASMTMDSTTGASTVSMGGAENRLDVLIREQQQTNQLMRQLVAALVAPPVRQQQSGAAPQRTFARAGKMKQSVDSAWGTEETLASP